MTNSFHGSTLSLDEIIARKMSHRKRDGSSHRSYSCPRVSYNRSNQYQRHKFSENQDYSQRNYRHNNKQQNGYQNNGANYFGGQFSWDDSNYSTKNVGGKWNRYNRNRKNRINQRPYDTTAVKGVLRRQGSQMNLRSVESPTSVLRRHDSYMSLRSVGSQTGVLRRHDSRISLASVGSQKSSGSRMSGVSNMSLGNRSYQSNKSWGSRASNCSRKSFYSCNSGANFQNNRFRSNSHDFSHRNSANNVNFNGRRNYGGCYNYPYNTGQHSRFDEHSRGIKNQFHRRKHRSQYAQKDNSVTSETPSVKNVHMSPLTKDIQKIIEQIKEQFSKMAALKPMLKLNSNPAECKPLIHTTAVSINIRISGYYQALQ